MLRRILYNFPSLFLTLGALAFGVLLAYVLSFLDNRVSFERTMWALINRMGPWWWGIPIASSMVGLWHTARLNRPRSPLGWIARVSALTGFVLFLGAWKNSALWVVSSILCVVALTILVCQLAAACAARRNRPSYRDEPMLVRLYASLTTDLDDLKRRAE